MKTNRKRIVLSLLSLALVSCATGPARTPRPVPAGYLYEGSYINVRAPSSGGWHLVTSSPAGMEFARSGDDPGESFGAQVLIFPLEETKDRKEFLSVIKDGFEKDIDTKRFELIESEIKYVEDRGYPCIRLSYVTKDRQAKTSPTSRAVLILQAESLYCRHPIRNDTGFGIIYSHRGKSTYTNIKDEARDFINGVQVPEK